MKKLQPKLEYFVGRMANDGHGLLSLQWLCRCRCRWWSWNPFLVELARFNEHWSNRINLMHSAGPWPISSQWLYFHLMWITRTSIIWCVYVDDVWFSCRNFVFYFNQQRTPRYLFSHLSIVLLFFHYHSIDSTVFEIDENCIRRTLSTLLKTHDSHRETPIVCILLFPFHLWFSSVCIEFRWLLSGFMNFWMLMMISVDLV